MKKRSVFTIATTLIVVTTLLMFAIFQFYKDSETIKRNIFVSEVGSAGAEIVDKIDRVLKGDSIIYVPATKNQNDSLQSIIFEKHAKKFLLDASRVQPIGIVRSTMKYMRNNVVQTTYDTTYFDTTLYKSLVPYPMPWETDISEFIVNLNAQRGKKGFDIEHIEMDTNTVRLLNKEFLYRIIKESLLAQNITADFEFALYNVYTTEFVVPPSEHFKEKIFSSNFVFTLKRSDKFLAPHFLILYFPTERLILLQRNSFIAILIVIFVSIIMLVFVFMLYTLYRQKKISDVKNDFINNMTHEFKTPISTIALACEALSDEKMLAVESNRSAYVSIITDENERLKLMVNNILQLAQLKKGQLNLLLEICNMHELIAQICDSFSLLIKTHKGYLQQYLYAEHFTLYVDKMHIENVISNLIENAIKYSKDEPNIAIRTENDKKNLIISVSDKGIGISKKSVKYIFNDFYRVPTGNIHNQKGQGLGLVYVKQIVELHGGIVTVISEPEKGTTFSLVLPLNTHKFKNL